VNQRRLSQALSEGDGISVIVQVDDPEAGRDAAEAGAEALVVPGAALARLPAIRAATDLPILVAASSEEVASDSLVGADACIVDVRDDNRERLEQVQRELAERFEVALRIESEERLEFVLEALDPELLVLWAPENGDEEPLEHVLELLPDVPAGKLAIADIGTPSRDEVEELERAGMDGVIVAAGNVAHLVGAAPPEV
jgi:indole-3-glycerol phosphate synthase